MTLPLTPQTIPRLITAYREMYPTFEFDDAAEAARLASLEGGSVSRSARCVGSQGCHILPADGSEEIHFTPTTGANRSFCLEVLIKDNHLPRQGWSNRHGNIEAARHDPQSRQPSLLPTRCPGPWAISRRVRSTPAPGRPLATRQCPTLTPTRPRFWSSTRARLWWSGTAMDSPPKRSSRGEKRRSFSQRPPLKLDHLPRQARDIRNGKSKHKCVSRSWSMGKSVTATLAAQLMHQGYLDVGLDEAAPIAAWHAEEDPRCVRKRNYSHLFL
jgi:hypothetical protein